MNRYFITGPKRQLYTNISCYYCVGSIDGWMGAQSMKDSVCRAGGKKEKKKSLSNWPKELSASKRIHN